MTYSERRDAIVRDCPADFHRWIALCGELLAENDKLLPAIVKLESSVDGLENENMRLMDELDERRTGATEGCICPRAPIGNHPDCQVPGHGNA